jgi:hypothetical protein
VVSGVDIVQWRILSMIKLKPWEALPVYIPISVICLTVARKNGRSLKAYIHLVCGQPLRRHVR